MTTNSAQNNELGSLNGVDPCGSAKFSQFVTLCRNILNDILVFTETHKEQPIDSDRLVSGWLHMFRIRVRNDVLGSDTDNFALVDDIVIRRCSTT